MQKECQLLLTIKTQSHVHHTKRPNATNPKLHSNRHYRLQRPTPRPSHHPHEPTKQLLCGPSPQEPAQKLRCTPTPREQAVEPRRGPSQEPAQNLRCTPTPREQAVELRRGPSHEPAQKLRCTAPTLCKQTKQKLHQGPSSAPKTQKQARCLSTKQASKGRPTNIPTKNTPAK
jgi:hypothetical protein